ncbi:WPP domain-interacting protein 1 [Euphorbia peplus]|nr:WPP domain-interacting protein 1 [Euphorbia peplus]
MNVIEAARCVCYDDMNSSTYPEEAELSSELRVADEVITKLELDLARAAEKLVNLSIRMMHASIKEAELEARSSDSLGDSVMETLEFDMMCGIVECEATEVDLFIKSVEENIVEAHKYYRLNLGEIFIAMEERLSDAEESLKQSQDQILEIREQSIKFQRTLCYLNGTQNWNDDNKKDSKSRGDNNINGQFSDKKAKIKMQTAKQQKHILRMLEQSLAREMELEKKLTEATQIEKDLKHKLASTQQELTFTQEQVTNACERWFEAENATEIFKGISKELVHQFMDSPNQPEFEKFYEEEKIDEKEEENDEEEEEEMISLELNSEDTQPSEDVVLESSEEEKEDEEDEEELIQANNYNTVHLEGWIWPWGTGFKFGYLH